jgi:hypothetical protein
MKPLDVVFNICYIYTLLTSLFSIIEYGFSICHGDFHLFADLECSSKLEIMYTTELSTSVSNLIIIDTVAK